MRETAPYIAKLTLGMLHIHLWVKAVFLQGIMLKPYISILRLLGGTVTIFCLEMSSVVTHVFTKNVRSAPLWSLGGFNSYGASRGPAVRELIPSTIFSSFDDFLSLSSFVMHQ